MMNSLTRPWRQMFNFARRATRTDYALYHVMAFVAVIVFEFVLGMLIALLLGEGVRSDPVPAAIVMAAGFAFMALFIVLLIGHVSVSVRRLHDQGSSGWLYLVTYIPLVGFVFWLILAFKSGDEHDNAYGPNPRHPEQVGVDELGRVFS